jgi:hypothetical protein
MCSRYNLTTPLDAVRAYFSVANGEPYPPRYNIAPTQPVLIVRLDHARKRELALVRWGLIPSWVKDPARLSTMINARAETATEKASFRGAMRHRRCLVPTNGFYEWTGKPGTRLPYLIRQPDSGLLAFAGLWETWLGADGSEIDTSIPRSSIRKPARYCPTASRASSYLPHSARRRCRSSDIARGTSRDCCPGRRGRCAAWAASPGVATTC